MRNGNEITTIGLIGLGLMGQGIASCLVRYGFNVIAYSRTSTREGETLNHISRSFKKLLKRNLVSESEIDDWEKRFKYVNSLEELKGSEFVIETVGESLELKTKIYKTIESVIDRDVVIATNTSGISLSLLQKGLINKKRFIGMHWGEPAEITRYLELSRAEETNDFSVDIAVKIGDRCGKQPTVLNYDIPGLISNRLMYAMIREAMHIVESGVADIETVDRSFRNDIGWWATLCGPFRWMDITGLPIYAKVMEGLFPQLSDQKELPKLMQEKVNTKSKFYDYSDKGEEEWEETWTDFTHDISKLVKKYEKRAKF
ncbi:MAG: 3-hydroxyacyl-CoA dehydrogenase family protein [Bacteroidota bacterium]